MPVLVLALVLGAALKAQSLQSESPPPPMTGVFNFAIADFGQIGDDGEVVAWGQGKNEGDRLFERVRAQLASMPSLTGMVEVRRQDVGLVRGKTPAERGHAAAQLAQKLGAHMVLYGNLERKGNEQWFEPEFFITGLSEAEELVGSGRLGTPIITEGSVDDIAGRLERSEALRARSEALTLFAIGLTYLAVDRPASAVDFFEQANAVQGWRDNEGKEVLYLFMGTAYRLRGAGGDTERAITAFSQAARLNPDYARAYVALGTVYLEEFDRTGQADFRNLDQAVVEYERAAGAKDQPESPLLDAKLHISLGNAYVVKAQAGDRDAFLHARDEFERIVRAYESGNAALQRAAAHAYLGLGIVAERGDHDCARAATFYRSAAEVATALRNREVKQLAEAQLAACGGVSAPLIS